MKKKYCKRYEFLRGHRLCCLLNVQHSKFTVGKINFVLLANSFNIRVIKLMIKLKRKNIIGVLSLVFTIFKFFSELLYRFYILI